MQPRVKTWMRWSCCLKLWGLIWFVVSPRETSVTKYSGRCLVSYQCCFLETVSSRRAEFKCSVRLRSQLSQILPISITNHTASTRQWGSVARQPYCSRCGCVETWARNGCAWSQSSVIGVPRRERRHSISLSVLQTNDLRLFARGAK